VSQIVGQSTSPEVASMRILESVCLSQGWDAAMLWTLNEEEDRGCISTLPGARRASERSADPGKHGAVDRPRSGSAGSCVGAGPGGLDGGLGRPLPGRHRSGCSSAAAWLVTGWAVPVRVGNRLIAILEFYCHQKHREERETMATLETVSSSLGQMLARSREQDRVEELHRTQEISAGHH
jgi:GAF domain-containing protein